MKIGDSNFFTESSKETDIINLPFVTNGIASISDDQVLGIIGVSFPFSETLILKDYKQLLKDLKLLSEDNNNGYDLETQEATYELLYTIDQLRCALKDSDGSSNLKAQVINPLLTCGISSANYLEYISTSAKTNLPYIVSLINSANTLRTIGATSPQVSILGLADSILLRGLANAVAVGALTAPEIAGIGFLGLILYSILSNAKLKTDTNTSTCTNTFGIVDRRFFIGKDLNNNDIKRTNTMVSISATNNLYNSNLNVIEPFPHIPLQPGIFSGCIQNGEYTFTLKFNDLSTFTMTDTVQKPLLKFLPSHTTDFWGGVFRSYRGADTVRDIITTSKLLKGTTYPGDLGVGVYLTRLNLEPIRESQPYISKVLRILNTDLTAPNNKQISLSNPEPCKEDETLGTLPSSSIYYLPKDGFIDIAINTQKLNILSAQFSPVSIMHPEWVQCLNQQYIYPTLPGGTLSIDNINIFTVDYYPKE